MLVLALTADNYLYATAQKGLTGLFCGKAPVIGDVDPVAINHLLDMQTVAPKLGKKVVECNIPGDSFQVCRKCQDKITEEQMNVIRPMVASYSHRLWHDTWHLVIDGLVNVGPINPTEPEELKENFDRAKSLNLLPAKDIELYLKKLSTTSGESFFYMHRQMIKMVNLELTANGLPCISSWQTIPQYNDETWPAPIWLQEPGGIEANLIQDHKDMTMDAVAKGKPEYLRSLTLHQLGNELAYNLHRQLHDFYTDSEAEVERKCQGNEYKSPTCDSLSSNVSSQVNRHFWKIHTYIDFFIYKWLSANDYKIISENCNGKEKCYQWKGTYLGNVPQ